MIFNVGRRRVKSGGGIARTTLDALAARESQQLSGIRVDQQTALRHASVFACIRVLAESVGQLPASLLRRKNGMREKAEDHPVHQAIRVSPNPLQTAQEFWEQAIVHLCLRGNFFALINRGVLGIPVMELFPMNPDAVLPRRLPGGELVYQVRFSNGTQEVLPPRDVFHLKAFSKDGLMGLSPISERVEALGRSMATERHAARFFSNSAHPGGVMATEQILNKDVYDRLLESWNDRYQGADNAHRTAILEQGLKWTQVGLSAEDAQMLESQKYGRTEVCGLFRVPPTMIGDLERATFSNTEQQNKSFVDYALMPYLTRIENRIKLQLLEPEERADYEAKFNVNAFLRSDTQSRGDFYTRQIQNGVLSPNEVRELEDLNPREGGDVYLTPSNMLIDGKLPVGMGASKSAADEPAPEPLPLRSVKP